MTCFADINVSQGSVVTYARCGGILNMHLTANLSKNLPVKKFLNRLTFERIMIMSVWPRFLAHPVHMRRIFAWRGKKIASSFYLREVTKTTPVAAEIIEHYRPVPVATLPPRTRTLMNLCR